MIVDQAIQKHCATAIFEAKAEGECKNYAPLQALGLIVETMDDAELIAAPPTSAFQQQTKEYWLSGRVFHFAPLFFRY